MRLSLLSLALMAALSSPAFADNSIEKEFEQPENSDQTLSLGVFFGGFFASDNHEFYDPTTSIRRPVSGAALDLGFRISYLPLRYVGAELEGNFVPIGVGDDTATLLGARLQVIGQYPLENKITPFAVAGLGFMGVLSDDDMLGTDNDMIAYLGAGAKYALKDAWSLRADARLIGAAQGDSYGGQTAHGEFLIGLSYDLVGARSSTAETLVENDSDSVDVPDEEIDVDSDGDGILGDADTCPGKPETVNSYQDDDGCPDEVPDSDGDGLNDLVDSCKDQAEDMDSFEDGDGCPDTDNDADGVVDSADNCPSVAGPTENRGCPDTDKDGDTVVDRLDNCPDEKGTPENQGCAVKQLVVITKGKLEILDKVFFTQGKANIRRRSNALLDNVAKVLVNHPEIKTVEVEGHTDDTGNDDSNVKLSQSRADAVVAYLVKAGVAKGRLKAKGYGEARPASEGTDRKSRNANRRVEFSVVE